MLINDSNTAKPNRKPYVFTLVSGKGGVGKTNTACNLAILLANRGVRVLVFDADMSLANVDVLFGLVPRLTVKEVLETRGNLRDIVVEGPAGISIIPSASGAPNMAELPQEAATWLREKLEELMADFDFVLIDAPSGIAENVQWVMKMANEVLLVTTPEPTAVTDAYAVAKLFSTSRPLLPIKLIVNMISDFDAGERISTGFGEMALRFLNRKIETIAKLPYDPHVLQAVRKQQPYTLYYPKCPATYALRMLAIRLMDIRSAAEKKTGGELANAGWLTSGDNRLANLFRDGLT